MRKSRFILAPLVVAVGLLVSSGSAMAASMAEEADDEVVLPSRVSNAINRAEISLDSATQAIDSGDKVTATSSIKALRLNIYRADKAARAQMNAVPVDEEAEEPEDAPDAPEDAPEAPDTEEPEITPADSVVAVLALDQLVATSVSGLFDGQKGAILAPLTAGMFTALNVRDKLLTSVIGLDPEGAGADYADAMADTVAGYDDEVSNFTEALAVDQLSAGGRKVLQAGLIQSKATQARVTLAFGGGE